MKRKNIKKNKFIRAAAKMNWFPQLSFLLVGKQVGFGLLACLMIWGYLSLSSAENFPINHVQVLGDYPHVDKAALKKVVMPHVLNGFFQVSLQDVKTELKQIPWVEDACVSRKWPDKITIRILEQKPVSYWNENGLLSINRDIFYPPRKSMPVGLPKLRGPEGLHAKVLEGYWKMKSMLEPLGLGIEEIELDKRHSWQLHLSNGVKVILGRNHTQERLEQFVGVYYKIFESRENAVHYVDLRYRHGIAVR